ncbi:MAG: hypothetical protein ACFE9L_13490 [Candidatus Hodarchaeota archaeon]
MRLKEISSSLKKYFMLRRMTRKMFFSLLLIYSISIIALTKQTIDFYWGKGCCLETLSERAASFNDYGSFFIRYANLDFYFPISLIGMLLMTLFLVQIVFVACFPFSYSLKKTNSSLQISLEIKDDVLRYYKEFLLFQLLFSCLMVFNLLYIEIFIIKDVCLLCSISQLAIIITTILVFVWSPFTE